MRYASLEDCWHCIHNYNKQTEGKSDVLNSYRNCASNDIIIQFSPKTGGQSSNPDQRLQTAILVMSFSVSSGCILGNGNI